ncbi:MAG TPA: hypothetical protein DDW76_31645 [Cyanobacteria bacterium UBA11369]|nr:hypothetical protein [Cyanobacteria bacterium UBA11371]HBE33263.1 hypothetical protein [Cyanobacteria bacterium UBA11368]HBE53196.1 hypothetical protein [Cyanobacteria bacterium UBA11369]
MNNFNELEWRSVALLRLAGYGLLLLSLFDYINIFTPPRFTNPVWEFQVMGEMVEKMPVPLIGFAFVFFGKDAYRKDLEEIAIKVLSWLALVLGIMFLLLIPLGVNNTLRIDNFNNLQLNNQLNQGLAQLQQVNDRLSSATSDAEINNALRNFNFQGRLPEIKNPQELKNRVLSDISNAKKQLQMQTETTRMNQKITLLKNSVKWNLGALISGVLFIYVWKLTNWAR